MKIAIKATATASQHFHLSPNGTRELVVVSEGPQQSVCRWLDTGDEICVCNSWLVPAERRPSS